MADKNVLAGLALSYKGKPAEGEPEAGRTYAVQPVAGGPREKAKGPDVVAELQGAFPKAHFLWLSKPVKAKAKAAGKGGAGAGEGGPEAGEGDPGEGGGK